MIWWIPSLSKQSWTALELWQITLSSMNKKSYRRQQRGKKRTWSGRTSTIYHSKVIVSVLSTCNGVRPLTVMPAHTDATNFISVPYLHIFWDDKHYKLHVISVVVYNQKKELWRGHWPSHPRSSGVADSTITNGRYGDLSQVGHTQQLSGRIVLSVANALQ